MDYYTEAVIPAVGILQTASGLSEEVAKTCVYYAVGTYGLDELKLYPILVIQGATGTGKSAAMNALKQLVYKPVWVGTNLSKAGLREELEKAKNATALIEEGDSASEDLVSNRYAKNTASTSVNKAKGEGWSLTRVEYFGATVLHKRKPFNDPATVSRSIVIKTRNRPGSYCAQEVGQDIKSGMQRLWEQSRDRLNQLRYSGRAADVWRPLVAVAATCGDTEWQTYAEGEVQKAMDKLKLGQEFEPEQAIVSALVALSDKGLLVPLADIGKELKKEYNYQPSAWAIADQVRELGFEVKTSHGQRKVRIDKFKLIDVTEQLGMEGVSLEDKDISSRNLT